MIYQDINELVQSIQCKYMTRDPYELAAALGIEVDYKPFEDLKGVYLIAMKNPYIYINESLDEDMEKLVLSHELGHHFLHKELATGSFQEFGFFDMTARPEREANTFAANLIISDEDVSNGAEDGYTSFQLARMLRVPHELFLIKLKDMNARGYSFNICSNPRANFLGR